MMKSAISKSVSRNEMMSLRESGMTNAEIAHALDITTCTVRNYIGNQPVEMTKASWCKGQAKRWERQRAALAASNAAVEVVTRSMVDIMKDSERKMAEEEAVKAKKEAIKKAAPIIKSSKTAAKATYIKRKRLVQSAVKKNVVARTKKSAAKPVANLKVSDHVVYLNSENASYQYNAAANSVGITIGTDPMFILALDQIPSLVSDLSSIHKNATTQQLMNKAW